MRIRSPLVFAGGKPPNVLLYARYSTEEQDASSIPDQFAYCRRFLEDQRIGHAQFSELFDAELSGELVNRPGIDLVREGIPKKAWDLIVCEDGGRLFRDVAYALLLVGIAVDCGIRVLCLNDDVDTSDEYWKDRLTDALSHHERSNRYTSQRIKRRHESLWDQGAALSLRKPGYLRVATTPASMGQVARGPFFDQKDEKWESVIHEVFERISAGDPPWLVAQWLTTTGLPKYGKTTCPEWTAKGVIGLIRRPDYRGEQTYRRTIAQKQHSTGKHKLVRNPIEENVLRREAPHLRIVSDLLWHSANEAINQRAVVRPAYAQGEHPLANIPRDSRGPLSQIFYCGICGAKMYQDGRGKGGYRCSRVRSEMAPCWNKATADRELAHQKIGIAVSEQMLKSSEFYSEFVELVTAKVNLEESLSNQIVRCKDKMSCADRKINNLSKMVESLGHDCGDAADKLAVELKRHGNELRMARLELQELESRKNARTNFEISPESIRAAIGEASARLLKMDREVAHFLQRLAPCIAAVPYKQFDSDKVVLRAEFDLHLAALLPEQLVGHINSNTDQVDDVKVLTIPMQVDLFEASNSPKFGLQAAKLKEEGKTLDQIGVHLGISKRSAHLAVHYGIAMKEAKTVDPFIRLDVAPEQASRWR